MTGGRRETLALMAIAARRAGVAVLLWLASLASATWAQPEVRHPATRPAEGIRQRPPEDCLLQHARIVVSPGKTLADADLMVRNGLIVQVASNLQPEPGMQTIDCQGKTIYPGLIDAFSEQKVEVADAANSDWNPNIRPELRMTDHFSPDASRNEQYRQGGFVARLVAPVKGQIKGTSAVVSTAEGNSGQTTVCADAGLHVSLTLTGFRMGSGYPGSPMGALTLVRQTLYDVDWYDAALRIASANPRVPRPEINESLSVLKRLRDQNIPLIVDASNELYFLRADALAREFAWPIIVRGSGREYRRLDEIAKTGWPVIVPLQFPKAPDVSTPETARAASLESLMHWDLAPQNPQMLVNAGVTIAMTTHGFDKPASLWPALRKAVRRGLSKEAALAALTTAPARLFKLDDRLGTIEPGKTASFVVAKGDLLEKDGKLLETWVEGARFELDRQEQDVRGNWSLQFGSEPQFTPAVEINGSPKRLNGSVKVGEKEIKITKVHWADGRLSADVPTASIDREGISRFTIFVDAQELADEEFVGYWYGPDGAPLSFTARWRPASKKSSEESVAQDKGDEPQDAKEIPEKGPENPDSPAPDRKKQEEQEDAGRDQEGQAQEAQEGREAQDEGGKTQEGTTREVEPQVDMPPPRSEDDDQRSASAPAANGENGNSDPQRSVNSADMDATETQRGTSTPDTQEKEQPVPGPSQPPESTEPAEPSAGTESAERDEALGRGRARESEDDKITAPLFAVNYPLGAYGVETPPAQPELVAFKNATVWTCGPAGILNRATVLIRAGKILAVGIDVEVPENALVLDVSGKHISPGIIDCHSHIATDGGLNEASQAVTAEVRISDFIDPTDISIYRQLAGGTTAANVLHGSANPIGGQNQVIKLRWGANPEGLKFKDAPAGIKFALGENVKQSNWGERFQSRYPQTRMGVEELITDAFERAREYQQRQRDWLAKPQGVPLRRDLELDALVEVLEGKRWIHCHSYRQSEILSLMKTCDRYGVTIGTFQHILEGYKLADEMARRGVMASAFADWWAYKFEVYDAIPYAAALMHQAGVVVSLNSDDAELGRHLNIDAAKAVKYGNVPPEEALKFVTLNPARQLRIDAYVGSLEVGKDADLVVWSASPLSIYAVCEQTWVDGREYFSLETERKLRTRDAQRHAALVQRILANKSEQLRPGEDDKSAEVLWPREDIFCHGHSHDHVIRRESE